MGSQVGTLMLLLPMLVALAASDAAAVPADERAELAGRRQAVEQGFQAAQAECATRFAVSSCLDAARLKRRDELVALQKAEAALDARARREASRRHADKPAAVPALAPAPGAASATPRMSAPDRSIRAASATPAASASVEAVPPPRPRLPSRADSERRSRAAYEERQQEAESRRRQVERRNAERPSKAAPLPVPASSAGR